MFKHVSLWKAVFAATAWAWVAAERPAIAAPGSEHVVIENETITFRWGATDEDMALLDDHPKTKTVVIGGLEPSDGPESPLAPFAITDVGFAHLARCPKLERLYISSSHPLQVTDDGLKVLRQLKALRVVEIMQQPFTDVGMAHLSESVQLEELWLDFNHHLGDGALRAAGGLPQLRVLRFYDAPITDAGIAHIKDLKELEDLQLGRSQVADNGLHTIGTFKKLKTLDLQYTPVTDAGLVHLKPLHLRWLCLRHTAITGKSLAALTGMTEMDYLILDATQVDDASLTQLARMKKLRSLDLSETQVTEAGLAKLAPFQELTDLKLNGLPITDRGIPALLALKNLRSLEMNKSQVTQAGFKRLAAAGVQRINIQE
ncbi:MAG: hypothetical protein JSS02_22690 [Planctomycetes bacterium]|nr:hypothetical protein [Planctomycetota bacterium]